MAKTGSMPPLKANSTSITGKKADFAVIDDLQVKLMPFFYTEDSSSLLDNLNFEWKANGLIQRIFDRHTSNLVRNNLYNKRIRNYLLDFGLKIVDGGLYNKIHYGYFLYVPNCLQNYDFGWPDNSVAIPLEPTDYAKQEEENDSLPRRLPSFQVERTKRT